MTNENRNWLIMVGALIVVLILGGFALRKTLEPPVVIYKEVTVTTSSTTSTTIVQVNDWCDYLDKWVLQEPFQAAQEWVHTQEPFDEPQYAMVEFARCSEFGKETARLIWPLWIGE